MRISLDLRVLGVRPDGYHELRTTFQSCAADSFTFVHAPGPFAFAGGVPPDGRNLVWRAADQI